MSKSEREKVLHALHLMIEEKRRNRVNNHVTAFIHPKYKEVFTPDDLTNFIHEEGIHIEFYETIPGDTMYVFPSLSAPNTDECFPVSEYSTEEVPNG